MEPIDSPTIKETLRKLFTDHDHYTHQYIISEIFQLPNLSFIVNRLMQNQEDIGLSLKSFIGTRNSNKLTDLLKEHINCASEVIKASIINSNTLKRKVNLLFENSSDISELISSFNPEILLYDDVKKHFDEHNNYVINLTTLYLNNNYSNTIEEYDCYYTHMLFFSDMLSLIT